MFDVVVGTQRFPVLGDSGCTKSCMSIDYFKRNPKLKKSFVKAKTTGRAINGSDVSSIGETTLKFSIQGTPMKWTFRIIKGLIDPIVLGWDWMLEYKVKMDAANGLLHFLNGKTAPLIEDLPPTCVYRACENIILPPNSLVHAEVELYGKVPSLGDGPMAVITEPFVSNGTFYAARTCSNLVENRFMTEFINTSKKAVRLQAGQAIGFAEKVSSDHVDESIHTTEMFCAFKSSNSKPTEPELKKEPESDEDITTLKHKHEDVPEDIPEGAKPLSIDYTKMAEDAKPFLPRLQHLLEVKHKEAFSRHDRDYGLTNLIQYRAHMKDPDENPTAQKPYRTNPEMRAIIDKQAYEMIANGLVGPSKSPFAAPILLNKKKCGGWRVLTDFRKVNERCEKVVYPLPRIENASKTQDTSHRLTL